MGPNDLLGNWCGTNMHVACCAMKFLRRHRIDLWVLVTKPFLVTLRTFTLETQLVAVGVTKF